MTNHLVMDVLNTSFYSLLCLAYLAFEFENSFKHYLDESEHTVCIDLNLLCIFFCNPVWNTLINIVIPPPHPRPLSIYADAGVWIGVNCTHMGIPRLV